MPKPTIGVLSLSIYLPGCNSLKEKRGRVKPLVSRLQREFKVSVAEIDHLDIWQSALIGCALISNDPVYTRKHFQKIIGWVDKNWPDIELVDEQIDIISA